jgi:hypothetical protein
MAQRSIEASPWYLFRNRGLNTSVLVATPSTQSVEYTTVRTVTNYVVIKVREHTQQVTLTLKFPNFAELLTMTELVSLTPSDVVLLLLVRRGFRNEICQLGMKLRLDGCLGGGGDSTQEN